jgi:hypothetical protein
MASCGLVRLGLGSLSQTCVLSPLCIARRNDLQRLPRTHLSSTKRRSNPLYPPFRCTSFPPFLPSLTSLTRSALHHEDPLPLRRNLLLDTRLSQPRAPSFRHPARQPPCRGSARSRGYRRRGRECEFDEGNGREDSVCGGFEGEEEQGRREWEERRGFESVRLVLRDSSVVTREIEGSETRD